MSVARTILGMAVVICNLPLMAQPAPGVGGPGDQVDPIAIAPVDLPPLDVISFVAEAYVYSNGVGVVIDSLGKDYQVEFRSFSYLQPDTLYMTAIYYDAGQMIMRHDAAVSSLDGITEIHVAAEDSLGSSGWHLVSDAPALVLPDPVLAVHSRNSIAIDRMGHARSYWLDRIAVEDIIVNNLPGTLSPWDGLVGDGVAPLHDPCDTTVKIEYCCVFTYGTGDHNSLCQQCCDTHFPGPGAAHDCEGGADAVACCLSEAAKDLCRRLCRGDPFAVIKNIYDVSLCTPKIIGL